MSERLMMGLERETAHVPSQDICRNGTVQRLIRKTQYGFWRDGSKMYVDGNHLEMCSPECDGPYELVASSRALDNRLFVKSSRDTHFVKCNHVGGDEEGNTFGSHESYSTSLRIDVNSLSPLLSFMASRHVLCGEGGRNPWNFNLCISPRLEFLTSDFSRETTYNRPLINTRNETHGKTAQRLHLICGGDNMSDRSLALKFGTTGLAVRMVEIGTAPIIANPGTARWVEFARKHNVPDEATVSTLARMQETWLLAAERTLKEYPERMPEWAGRMIEEWRHVLNCLIRKRAELLDTVLDWRIKNRLIAGFIDSRGGDIETNVNGVDELCFRYGALTSNGLYWRLRDRLDSTLPEGGHRDIDYIPKSGRARLRAALMKEFRLRSVDWSYARIMVRGDDNAVFTVHMDDAQKESARLDIYRGCGCSACRASANATNRLAPLLPLTTDGTDETIKAVRQMMKR